MLCEIASSQRSILIPLAIIASGIACGSAPGAASSAPTTTSPIVVIPVEDGAPTLPSTASSAVIAPPPSPRASAIVWMTSERDARDRARQQNLPLLVYVRADWAAPCLAMERGAWIDPRVAAAASRFVPLQLDVSETDGNAELYAERYGVDRIPEILVVDPAGRTLATSAARTSADDLVKFLRDVGGE